MRTAAIDVGTNTAQLLVADVRGREIERVHVAERFVRLGEGVDASGRIGEAALDRLCRALADHRAAALDRGAERFVVGATSAVRDAANRADVARRIREATGLTFDLLSGEEEATWSFAAACAPYDDLDGPCLVVDVGGGSTELVVGEAPSRQAPHYPRAIVDRISLDVGCIRLTERCFSGQPPPPGEVEAARRDVASALREAPPIPDGAVVIGTAGTAGALACVDAGPERPYDASTADPAILPAERVQYWSERVMSLTVDEILDLHPAAMDGRADVFPVGVLILHAVLDRAGAPALRVSPYELRYGLLLRDLASQAG